MLVALGASVAVAGADGKRVIPLDKFFTLFTENIRRESVLRNDEIITQIQVPALPLAAHSTYLKFKERESMDFALSSVAAEVQLGRQDGHASGSCVGWSSSYPLRASAAEQFLVVSR